MKELFVHFIYNLYKHYSIQYPMLTKLLCAISAFIVGALILTCFVVAILYFGSKKKIF